MKYRSLFPLLALLLLFQNAAFAVTVRNVVYSTRSAGTVVFSHSDHINKKGMSKNCRACHDAIFDLKKKKHFSMVDMQQGRSCGACHNGKKAFGLAACSRCHSVKDITYAVKETGPIHFSHAIHVKKSECGACHPSLYAPNQKNKPVGMAAMEKGASCGACHNAKQAFAIKECSKCHPTRELVFKEKSTGDVVFSHKFHTSLYGCADCHTTVFKTTRSQVTVSMQAMENGKSCGRCHDGKSAFSVKDKCESCHKM